MLDTILIYSPDQAQTMLIARILRNRHYFALPWDAPVSGMNIKGMVACGRCPERNEIWDHSGLPRLALGTAAPELCSQLGGGTGEGLESGTSCFVSFARDPLFDGLPSGEYLLHQAIGLTLDGSFQSIAQASDQAIGFYHQEGHAWGLQYPIERNDPDASRILTNFASGICGCGACWTEDDVIGRVVDGIRNAVPDGLALCAVSGGVDSTVCAKLAHMALGSRLRCIFVDTGLGQYDGPEQAACNFLENAGISWETLDGRESFLRALKGVRRAGDKERIVSQLMEQFLLRGLGEDSQVKRILNGTNLTDCCNGATLSGDSRIFSPLALLLKEEVRYLGEMLHLPEEITRRQPFPGSGLALRISTEITAERLAILRRADSIFREEIARAGQDRRLERYYAILSENPEAEGSYQVILRAAHSPESGAARLPFELLEAAARRIREELPGVNGVLYDLTPRFEQERNEEGPSC